MCEHVSQCHDTGIKLQNLQCSAVVWAYLCHGGLGYSVVFLFVLFLFVSFLLFFSLSFCLLLSVVSVWTAVSWKHWNEKLKSFKVELKESAASLCYISTVQTVEKGISFQCFMVTVIKRVWGRERERELRGEKHRIMLGKTWWQLLKGNYGCFGVMWTVSFIGIMLFGSPHRRLWQKKPASFWDSLGAGLCHSC